ncbi:MAG: GNAT family N-acetyltransferase [Bryobacteraceae bacterium]|jgi:GNAT superfamily N-acetyltransferase
MRIVGVESAAQMAPVRELFEEYWASFGFTPCFQNFGAEVAALPGDYAPPGGRLALAMIDGQAAGCVALRQFDAQRCEAKRLFVRPPFRGQGVGGRLLDWVIAEARAAGYREMVGDTMSVMEKALEIYGRMGFERTEPYADKATPGAIYLRLKL